MGWEIVRLKINENGPNVAHEYILSKLEHLKAHGHGSWYYDKEILVVLIYQNPTGRTYKYYGLVDVKIMPNGCWLSNFRKLGTGIQIIKHTNSIPSIYDILESDKITVIED